jgi:heme oxygenase (biliverdin-producing, ferredoxin)
VTLSLAERLKSETRALHLQAERTPFMAALLRGSLECMSYCMLLRNLHQIYASLEPALAAHADHPALAPVVLPGLPRTARLVDDLDALHGPGWNSTLALLPSAAAYARRLQHLAERRPELLLAHAYVRYLGDLSGGQVLRRLVPVRPGLPPGAGHSFYEFGGPAHAAHLAQLFRGGLGRVALDANAEDAVVAEACQAFRDHRHLFDELSPHAGLTASSTPLRA